MRTAATKAHLTARAPPPSHTHLLPQAYIIALGEPTGREPGAARLEGAGAHTCERPRSRRQSAPNRACPPPALFA